MHSARRHSELTKTLLEVEGHVLQSPIAGDPIVCEIVCSHLIH